MSDRLNQMFLLNSDFADAHRRGEKWALQQADEILGLDGQGSRQHPERTRKQDGMPHNWCGSCQHAEGCITCDLDGNPEAARLLRKTARVYR